MSAFDSVVDRVRDILTHRCRIEQEAPVWVACSGGADSVALAHVLHATQPQCRLEGLVFIDHGLRDVSTERMSAVRCAETLQVKYTEQQVSLDQTGNRQSAARDARYAALEAVVPREAYIATGHTLTDQAETVIQRLVRGSGIRGLQGIQARQGRWIRPLLNIRRSETRALGFPFEDDPTNDTSAYSRNRIREEVLPLLLRENTQAQEALARTAEQAQSEVELVTILVAILGTDLDLSGLPDEWVRTLTRWQYQVQLPDFAPPRSEAIASLTEHLTKGLDAKQFSIGNGIRATAENGVLRFTGDNDSRRSVVLHGPGAYALNNKVIKVDESDTKGQENEMESAADMFLDAAHIVWPLTVRPSRPSDRIETPDTEAGMTVRDALRAAGISWNQKRRKNVLIDGLGRVLWVGGIGRTSVAALNQHTARCVRVTFSTASELLI